MRAVNPPSGFYVPGNKSNKRCRDDSDAADAVAALEDRLLDSKRLPRRGYSRSSSEDSVCAFVAYYVPAGAAAGMTIRREIIAGGA